MAKRFKITVDGVVHDVVVEESGEVSSVASSAVTTSSVSASGKTINAPLQGTLQSFKVKVGDTVKSGDVTCIIEAMKMENDVPSIYDGVVKALLVTEGQKVESNQPLIEIG
ncbi:MAG: acetyl-CoA carboxylase biotin carboxyl carrier protein subunit [Lachnospiraceae bacterium]|nr:acetyl-CoA carboxylase biotin carboxyl carrier protein subunit [Lachnospiraceae bacterium]